MKKQNLLATALALVLAWLASAYAAGTVSARAQQIDPAMIDGLTEAINNRDRDAVLAHFGASASVTFDNSGFNVPNETITVTEYAGRFRPNNPDVPADLRMQVAPGSVQISATGAEWTWRQTAGFLRDMGIDYLEFTVVATTRDGKFETLTIAPTAETISKVPYSPPSGGSDPGATPGMPNTGSGSMLWSEMVVISLALIALGLVLSGLHLSVRPRGTRSRS